MSAELKNGISQENRTLEGEELRTVSTRLFESIKTTLLANEGFKSSLAESFFSSFPNYASFEEADREIDITLIEGRVLTIAVYNRPPEGQFRSTLENIDVDLPVEDGKESPDGYIAHRKFQVFPTQENLNNTLAVSRIEEFVKSFNPTVDIPHSSVA